MFSCINGQIPCFICTCLASTDLIAMDAHVMSGDEGLEDDHPACVGGSFKQRVCHLRNVHIGGVGG